MPRLVPHHLSFEVADIAAAAALLDEEFGGAAFQVRDPAPFDELTLADGSAGEWDHSQALGVVGGRLIELNVTRDADPPRLQVALRSPAPLFHTGFVVADLEAESGRLDRGGAPKLFTARSGPINLCFHQSPVFGLVELLQDCQPLREGCDAIFQKAQALQRGE